MLRRHHVFEDEVQAKASSVHLILDGQEIHSPDWTTLVKAGLQEDMPIQVLFTIDWLHCVSRAASGKNFDELRAVIIPDTAIQIPFHAFTWCSSLVVVKMPSETIVAIGECAFQYCSSLIELDLPASVKFIYRNAFGSCSLTDLARC